MLLILVFALLFFPSLAEEELRGVKHKYADSGPGYYMSYVMVDLFTINKKKK